MRTLVRTSKSFGIVMNVLLGALCVNVMFVFSTSAQAHGRRAVCGFYLCFHVAEGAQM